MTINKLTEEQEAIAFGVMIGRTPHKVEKRTMPHIRLSDGAIIMPDDDKDNNDVQDQIL